MRQALETVLDVEEGGPLPDLHQIAQLIDYHFHGKLPTCPYSDHSHASPILFYQQIGL